MNKLTIVGIVFTIAMLAGTYLAVGLAGGMGGEGDWVNRLAVLGAVVIVIVVVFVVVKYVRQMQDDTATGELSADNWDGIGEYKNELPMGWAVIFLGLVIWAIWYMLFGYPVNSFSQLGQYNEEVSAHDKKFQERYAGLGAGDLVEMGQSVFIVQCAPCHGLKADGINGKAADLNTRIELKSVKYVLENGSATLGFAGPMPDRNGLFNADTGAMITDAEIAAVSEYVANGMKGNGANVFAGTCSACHGADGKGMEFVAPDIAGFTPALVGAVLDNGKKGAIGTMPRFENLNAKQKEALGAYVTSLSNTGGTDGK